MRKISTLFMTVSLLVAGSIRAESKDASTRQTRIVSKPVASLDVTEQVGPIVLLKMPLNQVFDLLQTYSGRVVIPSADLPKATLTFKSSGTMQRDEAILALETLLSLNGVVLQMQDNGFVQAIPRKQILRSGPEMLEDDADGGEAEQQVYGRIFELDHLDSRTMYYQVRNLLSSGGMSSILNLDWRNALLIFDTQHNLDSVGKVIEMLDQPVEHRAEVYVVPVKNSRVHSIFYALIHAQRYRANAALYRARFHIDTAANHLVVVSSPEAREYIEQLVETLDRQIAPLTTSRIFPIKEGNIRTIYSILSGMVRHQQSQFSRRGFQSQETYRNTQKLQEPAVASELMDEQAPPSETPSVEQVVADLASQTGELQFSPYMGIWVDHQNYSLVVYGTPSDMKSVEGLINALDRENAPYTDTDVIRLKHAHATSIGGLLNHMVSVQRKMFARQGLESGASREGRQGGAEDAFEFSPYMYIWTERANNAIMVYGTREDIARIRTIISKLDVEQAPITKSRTFEIKYTQAKTVADMIARIIHLQRYAYLRQGIYSNESREESGTDTPGVETGFEFTPYAIVTADRTGNSLFVYGTSRDIQRVEELLRDLDRKTAPITKSKVYYLKHADSYSLSRIVGQVITSQRRIFQRRGLQSGDTLGTEEQPVDSEITMGFEFSDFAMVVADRRSNSLLLYGTDSDIERVDAIIKETDIPVEPITSSRVFPLKHAEANSLSRVIQIIVSSQRRAIKSVESYGEKVKNPEAQDGSSAVEGEPALQFSQFLSIVPDARNNALIVYGTHSDVEHISKLIEQTDVEVAPMTRSEVFFLENAKARTLASILTRMIRSQQTAMRRVQSSFHAVQYRSKDGDENIAPEILYDPNQPMQFSPYLSVVANDRNNSLLVYGTELDIRQLGEIINQNDIEVAPRTQSRIFHIKHADANEVVRTINPLITAQQRVRERESTLRRFFRRQNGELDEAAAAAGIDAGPISDPMDLDISESGLEFDEDLQFSPYVTLSADDRSNSIIVYGTEFDLQQVEGLIEQVDRVLPQVNIEVVIAEVMLEDGQVSGLDSFGMSYDNPFPFQVEGADNGGVASRGGILGATPELEGGAGSAGDIGLGLNPFSLQTVFRTAKENGKVRILSAPSITTTHNRPASINVGEARPIITSSTSTLDNSLATRSTVEYRDIGIELQVTPLVGDGGFIQMEVEQTVETVIDTQTIDNNEQPIIGTRRANSFVSVEDKQIIVMGGLQSEATIVTDGKVWILGDIPLIGRLFRPKKSTSTVRELIIFIRPTMAKTMTKNELIEEQLEEKSLVSEDTAIFLDTGHFSGELQEPPPQLPEEAPLARPVESDQVEEDKNEEN